MTSAATTCLIPGVAHQASIATIAIRVATHAAGIPPHTATTKKLLQILTDGYMGLRRLQVLQCSTTATWYRP